MLVADRDLGEGVQAYGVDGYPGDCVLLALCGLMRDTPPDLVVSGINNGPNLGFDWLASGTIGAARLAAVWGVPAIAASGLDASVPGALEAVSQWVVRLAQSELVRSLEAGQYLTVSFPRVSPDAIKGIKVAERAGILLDIGFSRVHEEPASQRAGVWALERPLPIPIVSAESDAALYAQDYIVVVPMRADEHDRELLARLLGQPESLPQWPRSGGGE
jgi:5'-nucleotidase